MQSSMWSFLQKKEGGEKEDIDKKINSSSQEPNKTKSSPKKKKEVIVEEKKEKKDTNKKSKKKQKDEDEDEQEVVQNDDEMELDENDNEKSKKKQLKSTTTKLDEKKKKDTKKKKEKENEETESKSKLKRLKRKVMDEEDNEDLDNLLDNVEIEEEKEKKDTKTEKEALKLKEEKEKKDKEDAAAALKLKEEKDKKDRKDKEDAEAASKLKERLEKEKSEKEELEKEKEEKEKAEKERLEKEKVDAQPQSFISDLFKRANAEAAVSKAKSSTTTKTVSKPTPKTAKNNKKQKIDHKTKSPPTSSPVLNSTLSTTTTTTATITTSPKKQTTTTTTTTVTAKVEEEEEAVVEEKVTPQNEDEVMEGDENDEDGEEEEEYEEVEEEVEEEIEEAGEKIKIKSKFIKKVPISKKKGNAKTIQADLKVIGRYHPINDAAWKKGEPLPYMVLAKVFETMEGTSSRLLIIEHLTNLFRSIMLLSTPQDLVMAIYLSINKIGPSYQSKELGIGEHVLIKSVAESTGRSVEVIKQELTEVGDLGIIAQNSRMTQPLMFQPQPLTIVSVFKTFQQIADLSGTGGQKKKMDLIKKLLVSCKDCETLYIIRSLQGKLRIGLAERSVLMALAKAILVTPLNRVPLVIDIRKTMKQEEFDEKHQSTVTKITRAYSQLPNYDLFVPHLIEADGIDNILKTCSLTVGIPVKPMLAQPTTGISQMLDRFSDMEFTCEFKYDGERAQIHHLSDGTTRIYTRNLEDYTQKYPDIIQNISKFIGPNVKSFILDCEAVAFDPVTKKILSFQVLSTRARKSVQLSQIKVPVCVFAFDLLYLNGKSLIDEPLIKRREILTENFIASEGVFAYAKYANISDVNDIQSYLEEAIEGNCEGLMVKTLKEKSIYEPSRRSYNWLKIKKDYMQGMTDSLDLVPIGAWYGKGKRTGTYGAYLLACYDENNDEFQTLCKIGTGFSDEQLTSFTAELKPHVINQPRNQFRLADSIKPDVWFSPSQVWEVLAADLSISPVHTAATGVLDPNKGIALRFPRFIRIRPDKNPEDATSAEQVVDMYQNQKINNHSNKINDERDEDY